MRIDPQTTQHSCAGGGVAVNGPLAEADCVGDEADDAVGAADAGASMRVNTATRRSVSVSVSERTKVGDRVVVG